MNIQPALLPSLSHDRTSRIKCLHSCICMRVYVQVWQVTHNGVTTKTLATTSPCAISDPSTRCSAGAAEELKLGDFGLTMSMKQELAISPVGTVEYMAPEVREMFQTPS